MAEVTPHGDQRGQLKCRPETILVERTIEFIRSQLPAWRDDPDRVQEQAEDRLNLQLCDYLECSARDAFPMVHFSREEPQTGQRKVDLAAKPATTATIHGREYTIYEPILVIEGKRLPAPTTAREREYVTGGKQTTGGIQRFKLGAHGARHTKAAIVAYLQKENGPFWCRTINRWIDTLSTDNATDGCEWDDSDRLHDLRNLRSTGLASCKSTHRRRGGVVSRRIELEHLWVLM